MLRRIDDMPPGTLGFEAVGDLDDDDWQEAVEPVLRREVAAGRKLRLLYLLAPRSGDVEGDAITAGAEFRARHATAFDRVAVVSDEDWLRPALRVLSVLVPGRTRAFPTRELAAAQAWLAEADAA
ncbi:MAG TPA: STAS/SEC14 domain-containing protein [Solirubrobacteraceae bacterium]|nr:STAS/SEC14 domain-containing protein [Solirubrobacteraceae bacterium]